MEEFKLSDDVFDQIKDFKYWNLTEEQKLLIDKLIINEELKRNYKNYGLCKGCRRIKMLIGVEYVHFNKISKIGLVEIMTLMSLSKKHNLVDKLLSGLNMIDLKMLNIWPKEVLELLIKQFGKMDSYGIGILKIINGEEMKKAIQLF